MSSSYGDEEDDYFEDDFYPKNNSVNMNREPPVYAEPVFLHETVRVASMGSNPPSISGMAASEDGFFSDGGASASAASSVASRVVSEGGWALRRPSSSRWRQRKRSLPPTTVQYRTTKTTSTGAGGLLGWGRRETVVDCGAIVRMPSG